jgi:Family of unknown function (DUF6796)
MLLDTLAHPPPFPKRGRCACTITSTLPSLDRTTLAWLRWSGIAGIVGSAGYLIGDVLLLGNSANPPPFPHLATYVDNRLIERFAVFLASSTERLAAGALAGVFSTPLYLAGIWHIFEASKPGGTRWSLPPFLLLVTAFSIAPFVHGSFFYVLEILKTVGQVDPSAQPVLVTLATRAIVCLFIAYGVLAVLALVGFAWLTVAIARRRTLYPRWVALANPLVCMLAALLIDSVLPQPFRQLLAGAGLSLGLLVFFALSTVVLTSDREQRAVRAEEDPAAGNRR